MKNIFAIFALFIGLYSYADDFTEFGIGYSDYDISGFSADSISVGYGQQSDNLRFSFNIGELDVLGSSTTIWTTGIDYGFGDWEAGTFYAGIGYTDSDLGDGGDALYDIGYRRSASSGTNYYISIVDCFSDCGSDAAIGTGFSFDVGGGNWLGLGYASDDVADVISVSYSKRW